MISAPVSDINSITGQGRRRRRPPNGSTRHHIVDLSAPAINSKPGRSYVCWAATARSPTARASPSPSSMRSEGQALLARPPPPRPRSRSQTPSPAGVATFTLSMKDLAAQVALGATAVSPKRAATNHSGRTPARWAWMIFRRRAGEHGIARTSRHAGPRCCWSSLRCRNPQSASRRISTPANGSRNFAAAPVRSASVLAASWWSGSSPTVSLLSGLRRLYRTFATTSVKFSRCGIVAHTSS